MQHSNVFYICFITIFCFNPCALNAAASASDPDFIDSLKRETSFETLCLIGNRLATRYPELMGYPFDMLCIAKAALEAARIESSKANEENMGHLEKFKTMLSTPKAQADQVEIRDRKWQIKHLTNEIENNLAPFAEAQRNYTLAVKDFGLAASRIPKF